MCLGIPGRILEIPDSASPVARVLLSGATRTVDISLVREEQPGPGDWVLVHAGFALTVVSEQEALDSLALLKEMADAYGGYRAALIPNPLTPFPLATGRGRWAGASDDSA